MPLFQMYSRAIAVALAIATGILLSGCSRAESDPNTVLTLHDASGTYKLIQDGAKWTLTSPTGGEWRGQWDAAKHIFTGVAGDANMSPDEILRPARGNNPQEYLLSIMGKGATTSGTELHLTADKEP